MLNVGVILVQIWCNTLCDDTHDIHDIARKHTINALYTRFSTILHDINGTPKTPRDNFYGDYPPQKKPSFFKSSSHNLHN